MRLKFFFPLLLLSLFEADITCSQDLKLNLREVPFSCYGSYMAFNDFGPSNWEKVPPGLYFRTIHGNFPQRNVFRIELLKNNESLYFEVHATPTLLRLEAENGGWAEFCFENKQSLRMRFKEVEVKFIRDRPGTYDTSFPLENGCWQMNLASKASQYIFMPLSSCKLSVEAPMDTTSSKYIMAVFSQSGLSTDYCEAAIIDFQCGWLYKPFTKNFEKCWSNTKNVYNEWKNSLPEVPGKYQTAMELAGYVNWTSVVDTLENYRRPAMLMSKNWMTNVWSWDHCFNSMALTYFNPQLGWDQFMTMIDHQHTTGVFPDFINDQNKIWQFCKPPVHGWSLKWMIDRTDFITDEMLRQVYKPLCHWTNFWFTYRDSDNDGIPEYNHGNDSGWDNGTIFLTGFPLESPDLMAFLIYQMDVLSEIALRLGMTDEAEYWKTRSASILALMIETFWNGEKFGVSQAGEPVIFNSGSLQLYLPLILGKRLPREIQQKLISNMKASHLTSKGLSTEPLNSKWYSHDGYWRGPIWAPSTLIIVDGLVSAGEKELAREISTRFCDMVSASSMAENFNAVTGEGLRDKAYTWTSSTFIILATEYIK